MKIGSYDIYAVEAGNFWLDGGAMFGVVPWVIWSKINPPDELRRIELATRCLLICGNGKTILVDTGNGDKWDDKQKNIYKFDNSKFDLLSSLKKYNITPQEVTDVVLTHLHFDHAGGSTRRVNGKLELTFPNARYYVQKEQWDLSLHPTEKDRASFKMDDFQLLLEKKVLELMDGEGELFPGIEILVTNGHTSAQQHPKISDGKTTLFYCSDLVPLVAHLPYPYIDAYDVRPLVTLAEKKKILTRAFEEQWILFFEHEPKTHAITLKQSDKGFVADRYLIVE